ncbi:uncharacterized protein [Symphalangus syndactylus]|uniref:uncharacterized protein isoform X3 n=1 Tax=Symphalangus syndactylus TaxID=9590 RepID=UPI00300586A0
MKNLRRITEVPESGRTERSSAPHHLGHHLLHWCPASPADRSSDLPKHSDAQGPDLSASLSGNPLVPKGGLTSKF